MHKFLFTVGISIIVFSSISNLASAQQQTTATPIFDALQAGILADPRVNELNALDPGKLVSEATYEVQWPAVHERDLYWKCRIYRVVDFTDEHNKALISTVRGQLDLAEVLARGVAQGRYVAYSAGDDRLSLPLSIDSVSALLKNAGISKTSGRQFEKFLIKQDWLYSGREKKLFSRIIGIAPLLECIGSDGVTTDTPVIWLYYGAMRPYLREQILPSTEGSAHNLDELFELWKFNSTIRSVRTYDPTKLLDFITPAAREYMLSK